MKNKPIKRSEEFNALSRDHHFGLLFCWKIKQGLEAKVDLSRIMNYVNYFCEQHLKSLFLDEESLIFDKYLATWKMHELVDSQMTIRMSFGLS